MHTNGTKLLRSSRKQPEGGNGEKDNLLKAAMETGREYPTILPSQNHGYNTDISVNYSMSKRVGQKNKFTKSVLWFCFK